MKLFDELKVEPAKIKTATGGRNFTSQHWTVGVCKVRISRLEVGVLNFQSIGLGIIE